MFTTNCSSSLLKILYYEICYLNVRYHGRHIRRDFNLIHVTLKSLGDKILDINPDTLFYTGRTKSYNLSMTKSSWNIDAISNFERYVTHLLVRFLTSD